MVQVLSPGAVKADGLDSLCRSLPTFKTYYVKHISVDRASLLHGKIFRIRERGILKGKVPAAAGIPIMNAAKIQPLFEDATEQLFEELKGKLGKIVKKSAGKF